MAVQELEEIHTPTPPPAASPPATRQPDYPTSSRRFDLLFALLGVWFIVGLYIDGAAHNHGAVDDTFFTPWHAILYSGVVAIGALLVFTQYRNVGRGYSWSRALPRGYGASLSGVLLFLAGGLIDLWWHEVFGFEVNIEALISPAHLLLASAAVLFLTGPLRAAWRRIPIQAGWGHLLPVVITTGLLLSLFTFFTMYGNPITQPDAFVGAPGRGGWHVGAVSGILILAALLMGCILPVLRRWRLPFGSLTLIVGGNALLMFVLRFNQIQRYMLVVVGVVIVGFIGDALARRLLPVMLDTQPLMLRFFAFALPFLYFLMYFVLVSSMGRLVWNVHMWLGTTFMAGIVGLGLSYLVLPPSTPDDGTGETADNGLLNR
jgi:hypothetical protein